MELDWSVDRDGGASFVGFRVRNDGAVPRRVRVESRLEGPLLPPRRGGVPEAGWDAAGVTAVVGSGERAAFGFAALADPAEPPVKIASVDPVSSDADGDRAAAETDDSVRAAIRDLESHRPPRRAVDGTSAADTSSEDERAAGATARDGARNRSLRDGTATGQREAEGGRAGEARPAASDSERSPSADSTPDAASADEVDAWFATVEARIERAERLTDADLETATATVREAGGLDAVDGLDERVAADAERLRAVRDRAAVLAERAAETDVPTEALEGLS